MEDMPQPVRLWAKRPWLASLGGLRPSCQASHAGVIIARNNPALSVEPLEQSVRIPAAEEPLSWKLGGNIAARNPFVSPRSPD